MESHISSQFKEILIEKLLQIKDEIKEEIDRFRARQKENMADLHSKLDSLMDVMHDRLSGKVIEHSDLFRAPLELNSNPAEELIALGDDRGINPAIKLSLVEDGINSSERLLPKSVEKEEGIDQNEENVDKKGVWLPLIHLQPILGSDGEGTVYSSVNGSPKAWFEESTSGLKAVSNQNAIGHVARKVFDETSQSSRAVLMDEEVNDPYTNGFIFSNFTPFDPGGGKKITLGFSRGVAHPLISKAHGTHINGMNGAVSLLRQAFSAIVPRDKRCLVASNHFHTISSGRQLILTLIVDIIAHGNDFWYHGNDFTEMDLKALFEETNSELLLKMLSFDPGGLSFPQMCCDPFGTNGEQGDYCLVTIMAGASVKTIILTIMDVEDGNSEVIWLVFDPGGCSLFPTGCDSFSLTDGKQHRDKFSRIKADLFYDVLAPFESNREEHNFDTKWLCIHILSWLCIYVFGMVAQSGPNVSTSDILLGGVGRSVSSKIRGLEIVKHMFDGMPKSFFVDQNEKVVSWIAMEDHELHDELWFSKTLMFVIDLGVVHIRGKAWPKLAIVLVLAPLMDALRVTAAKLFSWVGSFRCLHLMVAANATVLKLELGVELDKSMQWEIQAAFRASLWLVVHHLFCAKMQQPFVLFNRRRNKFVKATFTIISRASKCTAAPRTGDSAIDVADFFFSLSWQTLFGIRVKVSYSYTSLRTRMFLRGRKRDGELRR